MAENSKEIKRSSKTATVAIAIALVVGGSALWSINRSISHRDTVETTAQKPVRAAVTEKSMPTKPVSAIPVMAPSSPKPDFPDNRRVEIDHLFDPAPTAPVTEPAPVSDIPPSNEQTEVAAALNEAENETTEDMSATDLSSVTPSAGHDSDAVEVDPDTAERELLAEDTETAVSSNGSKHSAVTTTRKYYIAIGSYVRKSNALRIQKRRARWNPEIVQAYVSERKFYRLLVGPFRPGDLAGARQRMRAAGVHGEWPVRVETSNAPINIAQLDPVQ